MRALIRRQQSDLDALCGDLGSAASDLAEDLDKLQRKYLVDCVTFLEGEGVRTLFEPTPDGRKAYLDLIGSLYEIPE